MKKIFILFIVIICLSQTITSQTNTTVISENSVDKHFYFGLGCGIGFFYPGDVNDFIKTSTSNLVMTNGSAVLIENFVGRASFVYRINKTIDLALIGEYAGAPKIIFVTGGSNEYFYFSRISPGFIATFRIPIGSGRNSIFFASGILYNFMKFEQYKANGIGARLEMGFSFKKNTFQPFVCYDFAKATDDSYYYQSFELNYSGVQVGVDFYF